MSMVIVEIRGGCLVAVWKKPKDGEFIELQEGEDYLLIDHDNEERSEHERDHH